MDLNIEALISRHKNQGIKNSKDLGKALGSSNFFVKPEPMKSVKAKDKP